MMKKLVLHLQHGDDATAQSALHMIKHFVEQANAECYSAILLVTGSAVKQFRHDGFLSNEILEVAKIKNVTIELCHNAIMENGIDKNSLSDLFVIVPAGVYELVSLQEQGYAYVKA